MRDYASARSYAFIIFGAMLLVLAQIVLPAFLPLFASVSTDAKSAADVFSGLQNFKSAIYSLKVGGIASILLGFFDLFRNESVFCLKCGLRCRTPKKRFDDKTAEALGRAMPAVKSEGEFASKKADSIKPVVAPNQPISPLIKMLDLKSDKMRSDAIMTLKEVTDQDFGEDVQAWKDWWEENKGSNGKE
jgi:hypothetical protein